MSCPVNPARRALVGLALGAPLLGGCSLSFLNFTGVQLFPEVPLDSVAVTVADRANENNPVALDVVVVNEDPLVDEIQKLTARDWFSRKAQYLLDQPDAFDVTGWELVPGSSLPRTPVKVRRRARAGFVFANYRAPGAHRQRLGSQSAIRITLAEKGFTIADL